MNITSKKRTNLMMAKGYDMDEPEGFLNDLGFANATPQESGANNISFTDEMGVGYNVAYKASDLGRGIVQVYDVVVTRAKVFDQPPINQHDLLKFLIELQRDNEVETKDATIYKVIDFMNSYK